MAEDVESVTERLKLEQVKKSVICHDPDIFIGYIYPLHPYCWIYLILFLLVFSFPVLGWLSGLCSIVFVPFWFLITFFYDLVYLFYYCVSSCTYILFLFKSFYLLFTFSVYLLTPFFFVGVILLSNCLIE